MSDGESAKSRRNGSSRRSPTKAEAKTGASGLWTPGYNSNNSNNLFFTFPAAPRLWTADSVT